MKRYIAAILIPCLLLQLCGCYSQKLITLEELTSETDDEVVILLSNSDKYFLRKNVTLEELVRNPDKIYCIDADTSAESLVLYTKEVRKKSNQPIAIVIDTLKVNINSVVSYQKNELDAANTMLLSCGIILGVAIIIAAIIYEPIDMSGMKLFEGQKF
jgi:hypothetical protein